MKSLILYTNKYGNYLKFDLSAIPYNELVKLYEKGKMYEFTRKIFSFNYNELHKLNENNTFSVPANTVINEIKKAYKLSDWNILAEKSLANNIDIIIITSNINKTYEPFVNDMKKYGYYLVYNDIITYEDMEFNYLYFEPKYTNDISNLVRYNQLAIHLTTEENIKNIIIDLQISPNTG